MAAKPAYPQVNGTAQGDPNDPHFNPFFENASKSYKKSASNVTNLVIHEMLDTYCGPKSAHPITSKSVILDNACGPGTVTAEMLERLPASSHPQEIYGTDLSENMIKEFNSKIKAAFPDVKLHGTAVDAQKLRWVVPKDSITHAFMTFAIYSVPDAPEAIQEMYQTMRDGSICFITTWVEMGFMTWYGQAQAATRPDLPPFQGLAPMWWREAENVRSTMLKGGFAKDKVKVIPFHYTVPSRHFPDRNIMGGMIKMITGDWSDEDKVKFKDNLEHILAEKERADKEEHGGKATVPMIALIGIGEK